MMSLQPLPEIFICSVAFGCVSVPGRSSPQNRISFLFFFRSMDLGVGGMVLSVFILRFTCADVAYLCDVVSGCVSCTYHYSFVAVAERRGRLWEIRCLCAHMSGGAGCVCVSRGVRSGWAGGGSGACSSRHLSVRHPRDLSSPFDRRALFSSFMLTRALLASVVIAFNTRMRE